MEYIEELAKNWKQYDYSFDAREILPNGDEAWVYSTLELGLPVLWLKHPDGSFEHYVIHTDGYDKPTGEHWCFWCHCQMERYENIWKVPIWRCPKCKEEHYEEDVDLCSAPTEEASYADDELEPEEEWLDTYYRENPYIPHDEYDFDGF